MSRIGVNFLNFVSWCVWGGGCLVLAPRRMYWSALLACGCVMQACGLELRADFFGLR